MTSKKRRRVIESPYLPLSSPSIRKRQTKFNYQLIDKKYTKNEGSRRIDASSLKLHSIPHLDKSKFEELFETFENVKNLDLSKCYGLSDHSFIFIGEKWGKKIISLNLEYSTLTDNNLVTLLGSDPSELKKQYHKEEEVALQLRKINLSHTKITELGIRFIAYRCSNLCSIDLSNNSNITDLSVSMVVQHCKFMNSFNVSGCNITNFGVQLIAQECKSNLKVLDINDCKQIMDETLLYLVHYCSNLKRLRIRGTSITEKGIKSIIDHHALLELNVHGLPINDALLNQISYHQIQLEILDISFCHQITITGIQNVIKGCKLLKEIHIFGINLSSNEMDILRRQSPILRIIC